MKRILPWVCLIAAAHTSAADVNHDGINAYREGRYWQATTSLASESSHDPVALYYLGRMWLYGYGELKNNQQAIRYFKNAAQSGSIPAMLLMGRLALNIDNNPKDALQWFKKAADANNLYAQMYCIAAYKVGLGTDKNADSAEHYTIAAAKNGNVLAQYTLAQYFINSKHEANKRVGLAWLEKAANKQYPAALFMLGQLYATGNIVKKDEARAATLIDAALQKGYPDALMGKAAIAVSQGDYTAAKDLYTKAIDAGNKGALLAMAILYYDKKNPNFNPSLGFSTILKAAQEDVPGAAAELSELYKKGKNVAADNELAEQWAVRAKTLEKQLSSHPEQRAANWLTGGKEASLAASGYGLRGILNHWQNKNALEENVYNQSPQMDVTTRSAIYNPRFVMVMPNEVPMIDYYDAYIQSLSPLAKQAWDFPHYELVMPAVTDHLIEKAILGDSTAQFALGQLYQQGVSVNKDMGEAIKYYNKSAAQHDLRAEYNLGLLYLNGDNGKPDYQQAMGWLTDAAFKGSADAQYVLGQITSRGYQDANGVEVIPADNEQAISMFYLGSANHHGRSQYKLAELLSRESTKALTVEQKQKRFELLQSLYQGASTAGVHEADVSLAFFQAMSDDKAQQESAFNVALKASDEDNKAANLLLGLLYDRGIGVESSRSKAIKYYESANENAVTSFILGTYAIADDQDIEKGKRLLTTAESTNFSYAPLNLAILEKQQNQDFLPALLKARTLGNHTASLLLADYYLTQNNNEGQLSDVRLIYQQLAEKGDKDGQLKLGYMFEQGLGGPIDLIEASKWYEQAATQGQPIAQYRLGRLNQLGRLSNKPNYADAKKWYSMAMNQYSPAAVALGFIYDTVDDNYQQARIGYEAASNQGDSVGQFNLGLIYEQGKDVPVQYEKAQELYLAAAEKGHVEAMVQLAGLYLSGVLGSRDEKSALNWYQKAAHKGDREALYHLGLLAETGVGVTLDYPQAIKFYQASAAKGNAQAMLALARMYQFGQGVAKNNQEAETLYKELSTMGNAYAAYQLATMAYEGALGEQNKSQAQQWLQIAANHGSKQAEQVLQWLSAQTDARVSFIEPLTWQSDPSLMTSDEPAHWRYLGAVNAWNQGNEGNSRIMLNQLLQKYPNYIPAKEAYRNIQSADVWDLSTANAG